MKRLVIMAGVAVLSTSAMAGDFWGTWSYFGTHNVSTNLYGGGATRFDVTRNTPTGGSDFLLPQNPAPFATLCAEIGETIAAGSRYHDRVVNLLGQSVSTSLGGSTGPVNLGGVRTTQLRRLWFEIRTNEGSWNSLDWAAAQLAQWEILFDTNLSLASGSFNDTGTNATLKGKADALLASVSNLNGGLANIFLMSDADPFSGDNHGAIQDQITGWIGNPPNTVPEPFTMGLGAAAAGLFVRRRLKAKAA